MRTSTQRSSCCFDITRYARRYSSVLDGVAARRVIEHGGMPRAGDALAQHRWMDVDHGLSFRASDLSAPLSRSRPRPSRTGSPARHLAMPSRLPVPHVDRQFTSTRRCCFPSTLSRSPDHRAPPDESRERMRRSAFQKAPRTSPPKNPGLPSIRPVGFYRSISSCFGAPVSASTGHEIGEAVRRGRMWAGLHGDGSGHDIPEGARGSVPRW